MKLNWIETVTMNNPVRRFIQRHYETPKLKRLGTKIEGQHVLEIGCGRGIGIELLFKVFGVDRVDAFDLDPKQVERARRRLRDRYVGRLSLEVGDASRIEVGDGTYDAVFDYGIIHHIPDWRAALCEVARVIRPGGQFFFEEVLKDFLETCLCRLLLVHPEHDRFTADEFVRELELVGLEVGDRRETLGSWFLFGVARKTGLDKAWRVRRSPPRTATWT